MAVRHFPPLLFLQMRSRAVGTPRRGAALGAAAATPRRDGLRDSREGSGRSAGAAGGARRARRSSAHPHPPSQPRCPDPGAAPRRLRGHPTGAPGVTRGAAERRGGRRVGSWSSVPWSYPLTARLPGSRYPGGGAAGSGEAAPEPAGTI